MTIEVDNRLEFLTALVVAYKEKIAQNKDDFDWVEYPENKYVRSLIERINIENHSEIYPFLGDMMIYKLSCRGYLEMNEAYQKYGVDYFDRREKVKKLKKKK